MCRGGRFVGICVCIIHLGGDGGGVSGYVAHPEG